jgi:ParB/RepB/Spo0J family partition protein
MKSKSIKKDAAENIQLSLIDTNEWNPNEMSDAEFCMLVDNIKRIGFVDPISVIKDGARYKIIDGEHRYQAALLLGMETISAVTVDIADIDDQQKQTMRLNNIKGEWNPIKFNTLVTNMINNNELTIDEAAYELGFADPNDFYLLRDLLRETMPSKSEKKVFDKLSENITSSKELYKIVEDILSGFNGKSSKLYEYLNKKSIFILQGDHIQTVAIKLRDLSHDNDIRKEKLMTVINDMLVQNSVPD